jgi:hypothetical protein
MYDVIDSYLKEGDLYRSRGLISRFCGHVKGLDYQMEK